MSAPLSRPPRFRLKAPALARLLTPTGKTVEGMVDDLSDNGLCFSAKPFSDESVLPKARDMVSISFDLGSLPVEVKGTAMHVSHRGGRSIVGVRLLQRMPTKVIETAKAVGAGGIAWKGQVAEVHGTLSGQMWREWLAATRSGCTMRLEHVTQIDTAGAALIMNSLDKGAKILCPPGKVADLLQLFGIDPSRLR